MNPIYLLLTIIALWALSPLSDVNAKAAEGKSATFACNDMAAAITPYIRQGVFSGNVLIARKGQVLCQKSVGYQDDKQQQPMTADGQFSIASLSKPMMATLVLRLKETGEVRFASPPQQVFTCF